jgi:hypothetical protein
VKSLKANVLCTLGIALAIFSVGCGDAIQKSQSTVAMFGYVFLSCSFLAAALVLCAIGVSSENERIDVRILYASAFCTIRTERRHMERVALPGFPF